MEPNIPVGSEAGVTNGMARAVAGAEREQREGASGKWVAHWKMVHIVRPVWETVGRGQSAGPRVSDAHLHRRGCANLTLLEDRAAHHSRRARSAQRRHAVRQRVRAGHAGGGAQAGRFLRQRRRALPDGRHGDRRDSPEHPVGVAAQGRALDRRRRRERREGRRSRFTPELFARLLAEEFAKLQHASNRDVHDDSKTTTLPIAREIVEGYVPTA